MATTVEDVLDEMGPLLNDPDRIVYPDAKVIPLLNKAYKELQRKYRKNQISTNKEVSSPIVVPANTTALVDGALLPAALIFPISMYERPDGSTSSEDWIVMLEEDWEPLLVPTDMLRYWVWREEEIKLLGATVDKEVLLRYMKGLPVLDDVNDDILITDSLSWLASRTASIVAAVLGSNPTRAKILQIDADDILSDMLGTEVNRKQSRPVRRRRTRYRR